MQVSKRSSGFAPSGWPSDDVADIDASANELRRITSDVIKKLSLFIPSQSSSVFHSTDLTSFSSDSLQHSGNSGDRHAARAPKQDEARFKSNHIEVNGFCSTSNEPRSQQIDLTMEGDCISCDFSSSKDNSKNFDLTESRLFPGSNALVSSFVYDGINDSVLFGLIEWLSMHFAEIFIATFL